MTREIQRQVVIGLCDGIRDKVLALVDDGHSIPEEWNGLELRQLLAELFWQERGFRYGRNGNAHPTERRVMEYRNAVLVNNLDR